MSVFKRGNAFVAKFQRDGKQVWVPGGPWPSKREAREAERQHRYALATGSTAKVTAVDFADQWLEMFPRPQVSTTRLYAAAATRFAEHFGTVPLAEVSRMDARAWALTVPRGVSQVIGTMYEDARDVEVVDANPFANLRLPATERKARVRPPTVAEYRALLDACGVLGGYGPEFRAMVQFAAWTGIRQGELFALQWPEVGETEVVVKRSRKLDGTLGLPKNGKERTVPLLPPARVLDQVPRRPDDYVFHSARGRPLSKATHAWAWQQVRAAAHVRVRWHDLRHYCATQLLEAGLSHFDVSVQLGHEDGGKLVMERYGHPSVDAAKARLQAVFEPGAAQSGSKTRSRQAS